MAEARKGAVVKRGSSASPGWKFWKKPGPSTSTRSTPVSSSHSTHSGSAKKPGNSG